MVNKEETERDWARHKQSQRGSISKGWNIGQRPVADVSLSSWKTKAIFMWMRVSVQSCREITGAHSVFSSRKQQRNIKIDVINVCEVVNSEMSNSTTFWCQTSGVRLKSQLYLFICLFLRYSSVAKVKTRKILAA